MTTQQAEQPTTWGSDGWGSVNQLPSEIASSMVETLELARTLPAFQEARRRLLRDLGLAPGHALIEGGAGTGASLPDVVELLGRDADLLGIDPTVAFVEAARRRARELGATNTRYEIGDIRALPAATDSVAAAFCDKVLIHAGPGSVVLQELARVVRPGGRVGAVDWQVFFVLSTTQPRLVAKLNAAFVQVAYDYAAAANLAQYFHAAGLVDVQRRAYLAHTDSVDGHPFWRNVLEMTLNGVVAAGDLSAEEGQALSAEWEALNQRGEFSCSFVVQSAVGTKPDR